MTTYEQQLEDLKEGIVTSITIEKEKFLEFREVLILREDFKHFRGIAKQGGIVIYTYEKSARS
ncbi:hypothetical protein ACFPYN_01630 [Paenisporosarcina macmurdoensis]|uniref:Abortive phage infection protein n=1 Tax=Paenisporosarcina macmurdoensis TaxID=212659 RepID=A0ABW1L4R6_9BACL